MSRNTNDGWYSEDKPNIGMGWENDTVTYMGIVHNSKNQDQIPMAQVFVPELHAGMTEDERNELPWSRIDLGAGTGSGTDSTGYTLTPGQSVQVERDERDVTEYTITKKLPFHKPSVAPNNTVRATQTEALPGHQTNLKDDYVNPSLTEAPIAPLVTANLAKLSGTIFGIFNSGITTMVNNALGSLQRVMAPFNDILDFIENFPDFGAAAGFSVPKLTIGVGGAIDLSQDMSRMVDAAGGEIGNVSSLIKVDGWKAKTNEWEYAPTFGEGIDISTDGIMSVQPGQQIGPVTNQFVIRNKSIDWSVIDALPAPAQIPFYAYLSDHVEFFTITTAIVSDLSKLDFSLSENFMDSLPAVAVGPTYASEIMPKVEFKLDPKTTDKAIFGQLHVVAGMSNKTASIEIDMTTSDVEIQTSNKKV